MSPSYEGGQGGKGIIPSSILSEWKQPQQQAQSQSHHQQQQQQINSSRLSTSCPFIYSGAATAEIWPPRFYSCSFCRREFRSAQALGGHMNVHRRDRALLRRRSPPPPSSLEEDNPNNNDNSNNLHSDFPQPCKRSGIPFHASTVTVASANLAPLNSSFLNPSHSENPTAEGSSNYYYSSCRPSYLHSSFRSNPYSKDSSLPSNHFQTEEISVLHSSPMNLRPSHSNSSSTHHAPSRALCSPNELDLELRLGYSDLQSLPKNPP